MHLKALLPARLKAIVREILDRTIFVQSRVRSYLKDRLTGRPAEVNLLISLYPEQSVARREELELCLAKNLACRHICKIYIFFEGRSKSLFEIPKHPKIEVIDIGSRPSYKTYFDFASEHLKGKIVAIANSDIFFDMTLVNLRRYDLKDKVLALTRYNYRLCLDHLGRQWKRNPDSQDVWIFLAPLKPVFSEIYLGWLGCDGYIAREIERAGLQVLNPSRTLMTWHVHLTPRLSNAGNYHDMVDSSGSPIERIPVRIGSL